MGANHTHFKIEFKKQKYSHFWNNLFLDFQDYSFPKILDKKNPLEELFNETNYAKIRQTLAFAWCAKGDGLAIEKFSLNQNFFELDIYGGSDMMFMEELIFYSSYYWGTKKYLELQSTTRASGLDFRWIKNEKAFQYGYDESGKFEELNLNNGFDYCFKYIDELLKKGKIEISEIKLRVPNQSEFLSDLKVQINFLERIKNSNNKWEVEQERTRQRLLNYDKSESAKKEREKINKAITETLKKLSKARKKRK